VTQELAYHRPDSLAEACKLLRELGPDGLPLAGGTDVVVDLRRGAIEASQLVSLDHLAEMRGIRVEGDELRIGALTTPAQLEASDMVHTHRPELLDVVGVFGTPQVRNRATIGGNLCTAASCADLVPFLMAVKARVVVAGWSDRREVQLDDLFDDHRKTTLEPGVLVVEVIVPSRRPNEGAAYQAFGLRAANFISVAAVAAALRLEDRVCREARLVLGAVAPTPLRVPTAEEKLEGSTLDVEVLREAASVASLAAAPISDVRGSAEHRRELVSVLAMRALTSAWERAQ
jgi:carbon-monoxide dehydrogenase medium subunit